MAKNDLKVYPILEKIRQVKPLVHHLTNWVTIYDCAAVVKALGGSPVMAHAEEEAAEMAGMAQALVLNIGTLTVDFVEVMKIAGKSANAKGIPVIFDACGAGATRLRDEKCVELLREIDIGIIKGNVSEIARVAGINVRTKGVDAAEIRGDIYALAARLSAKYKCAVAVTGKEDVVSGAGETFVVKNGHALMADVVGTGCMVASVIGAFAAVEPDLARAAAAGLSCFGIAGECAAMDSAGPAEFKIKLIDALYNLDKKTVERRQKIERV